MQIVVLDGYTLNPGDLFWDKLKAFGPCTIFDRTLPSETVDHAKDAEILLTNKTELPREIIEQLPRLKYIGVLATGYNVVDIQAARERNIPVTNVPTYSTMSVAQMVFAHILNLCQHVEQHSRSARVGKWSRAKDFCYWDYPLIELSGLTIGIVGLGKIGQAVAGIAHAFGMNLIGYDPAVTETKSIENVKQVTIDLLFRESDIITLHCPLTKENRGFINSELLSKMKPTAFLINTSRGPLVDEQALADALNDQKIAGAGLDVLSHEPPSMENPLLTAKNCYITPHIAWATRAARERLMNTAIDNVKAFLDGQPRNVVN